MRSVLGLLSVLAALPLAAQPVLNTAGAVNAASYSAVGLPNSSIAQGSIFVAFGQNLGPASIVSATYPLTATLAGTSASVTVNGATVAPLLLYTVAGQVAMLMPSSTPTGSGTLTVTYGGHTSPPITVQVSAANFGIFTVNQAGSGPAVVTDANYAVISPIHVAAPGQTLILWGTGLGKIAADESQAPPQGNVGTKPSVWVGSQPASVSYWGRAGCCAGLDQINFQVPAGLAGCFVSVAVQTGGTVSNFGSIAVAGSGSMCSDDGGLTPTQLSLVQNGQDLNVATLSLSQSTVSVYASSSATPTTTVSDSGSATFLRYTPAQLLSSSFGQSVSVGSCMVFPVNGTPAVVDPVQPAGLNAGTYVTVGGPIGTEALQPMASLKGYYGNSLGSTASPPLFLDASPHTFNIPGSVDMSTFTEELPAPPTIAWSNQSALSTVSESQGVTVNWTNAVAGAYVAVTGYSFLLDQGGNPAAGASFICNAHAGSNGSGQFTVPASVLLSLPLSATGATAPSSFLGVGTQTAPGLFFPPVKGLDVGFAYTSVKVLKNVTYTQ